MDKVHKAAVDAEKWVAEVYGGRRTTASGSGTKDKGDVIALDEVFEVKYTEKQSFSLKLEDLMKINIEAIVTSKRPVFHLNYGPGHIERFVVLREDDYLDMRENDWRYKDLMN